jgi:hypothetical protein
VVGMEEANTQPESEPVASPPQLLWYERWRIGIRTGETAIIITLWAAGVEAADMIIVALMLVAALVVGAIAIATDPSRSGGVKTFLAVCLTLSLCGSGGFTFYRRLPAPLPIVSPASALSTNVDAEELTAAKNEIKEQQRSLDTLNKNLSDNQKELDKTRKQLSELRTPQPVAPQDSKISLEKPTPSNIERVVLNMTLEALLNKISDRTEVEASAVITIYVDKWIKVSGEVRNVANTARDSYALLILSIPKMGYRAPIIQALTFVGKWRENAAVLSVGQYISTICRIAGARRDAIDLRDCELVEGPTSPPVEPLPTPAPPSKQTGKPQRTHHARASQ